MSYIHLESLFYRHCVCIHIDDYIGKFHCLVVMLQKLFSVVQDKSCVEGADAVMMQELLLGGHLYLQVSFNCYSIGAIGGKMGRTLF